jgi:hypothetical protein
LHHHRTEWVSRTTSEDPTQRRKCRPQTQQKSETRCSIACVETAHMNDEGVVVQVPRYQQWQLMQTGRQWCVVQRESNRMNYKMHAHFTQTKQSLTRKIQECIVASETRGMFTTPHQEHNDCDTAIITRKRTGGSPLRLMGWWCR